MSYTYFRAMSLCTEIVLALFGISLPGQMSRIHCCLLPAFVPARPRILQSAAQPLAKRRMSKLPTSASNRTKPKIVIQVFY